MEPHIVLDGKTYEHVVHQRGGVSSVYRSLDTYARVGVPAWIDELVRRHRMLEHAGFPVAKIAGEGTHGDMRYYIESSLGETRLGATFREEWKKGHVSDAVFSDFLQISLDFSRAQIAAGPLMGAVSGLEDGIRLQLLLGEMPSEAQRIRDAFAEVSRRLAPLPIVACHGDFNPQNLFTRGVIDFEDMFAGPAGYDQVSAIVTTDWNPESSEFEFPARYRFTEAQKEAYYQAHDELFTGAGLPRLSAVRNEFEFCRGVWAATRMEEWPKTRAWRHERIRSLLDATLSR